MRKLEDGEYVITPSKTQWCTEDFGIGDIVATLKGATYLPNNKGRIEGIAFDNGNLRFLVNYDWEDPNSRNMHWERIGDIGKVEKKQLWKVERG